MNLSPQDRKAVLALVAENIVAELRAEAGGDFSSMIVLPLSAVSQLVGLSGSHVSARLPGTECANGKHGVTLHNIREFVESRTRKPRKVPA